MNVSSKMVWVSLLIFEILSAANALVVFRAFDRAWAGFIAGSVFVVLGLLALFVSLKHSVAWRGWNVFVAVMFTFVFSLPMILARLLTPFSESVESVVGIPVDIFHRGSEISYLLLVLVTIAQIFWSHRAQQKTRG